MRRASSPLMLRASQRARARDLPGIAALRCVSKHEGACTCSSSSFETRARAFEVCRTSSTCALLRMRTSIASFTAHDFKQPTAFSRRVGVRGLRLLLRSPRVRVGGAPRDVRVQRHPLGVHITRHARRLRGALRPITRDARLSALHRGGFGPRGRASVSFGARRPTTAGSCLPDPCSELLAARS